MEIKKENQTVLQEQKAASRTQGQKEEEEKEKAIEDLNSNAFLKEIADARTEDKIRIYKNDKKKREELQKLLFQAIQPWYYKNYRSYLSGEKDIICEKEEIGIECFFAAIEEALRELSSEKIKEESTIADTIISYVKNDFGRLSRLQKTKNYLESKGVSGIKDYACKKYNQALKIVGNYAEMTNRDRTRITYELVEEVKKKLENGENIGESDPQKKCKQLFTPTVMRIFQAVYGFNRVSEGQIKSESADINQELKFSKIVLEMAACPAFSQSPAAYVRDREIFRIFQMEAFLKSLKIDYDNLHGNHKFAEEPAGNKDVFAGTRNEEKFLMRGPDPFLNPQYISSLIRRESGVIDNLTTDSYLGIFNNLLKETINIRYDAQQNKESKTLLFPYACIVEAFGEERGWRRDSDVSRKRKEYLEIMNSEAMKQFREKIMKTIWDL